MQTLSAFSPNVSWDRVRVWSFGNVFDGSSGSRSHIVKPDVSSRLVILLHASRMRSMSLFQALESANNLVCLE